MTTMIMTTSTEVGGAVIIMVCGDNDDGDNDDDDNDDDDDDDDDDIDNDSD